MDHATRPTTPWAHARWGFRPARWRGIASCGLPTLAAALSGLLGLTPALGQTAYTNFTLNGGPPFVGGVMGTPNSVVFNGQTTLHGGSLHVINLRITGPTTVTAPTPATAGTLGPVIVRSESQNREPALTNEGVFTVLAGARLQLAQKAIFVNAPGATLRLLSDQGLQIRDTVAERLPTFVNSAGASFESAAFTQVYAHVENNGRVTVPDGGSLSLWNGGAHHNAAWQGSVQLRAAHGLTGTHTVIGRLEAAAGTTTLAPGATLHVDPSVAGVPSGIGAASGSFVNAGVIDYRHAPGDLFVGTNGSFLNRGRIQGEVALRLGEGTFTNEVDADVQFAGMGSVGQAVPGALLRNAGDLQFRSSARIALAGTVENQSTGVLTVHGHILPSPTGPGTVRNAGDLRIASGGHATVARVDQLAGRLQVSGNLVVSQGLVNESGSSVVVTDTGLLRHAAPGPGTSLTNRGASRVAAGGTVEVGTLVQEAGTLIVDGSLGSLNGGELLHLGGVLSGHGQINGDVFTGGGPEVARFTPGSSPGTVTIDGAFHLLPNGILALEIEKDAVTGQVSFDQVRAHAFFLDGLVQIRVGGNVVQVDVAGLSFLGCDDGCSIEYGDNFVVAFIDRPGSDHAALSDRLGIGTLAPAPVPEPQAWALMAAGLAVLGAGLRRRRRAVLA